MKKILVIVDMQNDFIDGSLGTQEAKQIVPAVVKKITDFDGDKIFVTFDTHKEDYLNTLEGKKLPVPHCVEGTEGHELNEQVFKALDGKNFVKVFKETFGCFDIVNSLKASCNGEELEIELVGLCTDICVASNAIILRAGFPNSKITVDSSCCAGVTIQSHEAALVTMQSCQIDIV